MAIDGERLLVRELKCFMCGYTLGEVIASSARRVFRPSATCPPLTTTRLDRVRCPRCNGPAYLEGAETMSTWSSSTNRLASASRRN